MKKICMIAAFCTCLLAAKNVHAQKTASPDAKVVSDENTLKPPAGSTTAASEKSEASAKPILLPLKKGEPQPALQADDKKNESTATEPNKVVVKADAESMQPLPKTADIPKTPGMQPAKKPEPLPLAAPVVANVNGGN
jgi:hypothetical protein